MAQRTGAPAAVLLAFLFGGQARAAEGAPGQITGDHRLEERFIEDGAIVQKGWIEATAGYAQVGEGNDVAATLRGAFRLGRDAEAGLTAGVLQRRRDSGEILFGSVLPERVAGRGLQDPLIYGKYRILRSPIELAVGAGVELPLADDRSGRGPGSVQYRTFVGVRRAFPRATLIWSLGASSRGAARATGEAAGRTGGSCGTGVLVPLGSMWTFVAEATYESARFAGDRADGRALGGLDWRPTENVAVRGMLGGGVTSGAPDRMASVSLAYHF